MTETSDVIVSNVSISTNCLPVESWVQILSYLRPKELKICSELCDYWNSILCEYDDIWMKACRNGYPEIYEDAYRKTYPKLSWRELCNSLLLWKEIDKATIVDSKFACESVLFQYSIQENGEVALCYMGTPYIRYYNIKSIPRECDPIRTVDTTERIALYQENKYIIAGVTQTNKYKLFMKSKLSEQPLLKKDLDIAELPRTILLREQAVYIVTYRQVFEFRIDGQDIVGSLLFDISTKSRSLQAILYIGHTDCLNVFVKDFQFLYRIYSQTPEGFLETRSMVPQYFCTFENLVAYNILESYVREMKRSPFGYVNVDHVHFLEKVVFLKQYGDIIVALMKEFELHIYRKTIHSSTLFEPNLKMVFKLNPCNFSYNNVTDIDIVEIQNGHKIYLTAPFLHPVVKVFELTLKHG